MHSVPASHVPSFFGEWDDLSDYDDPSDYLSAVSSFALPVRLPPVPSTSSGCGCGILMGGHVGHVLAERIGWHCRQRSTHGMNSSSSSLIYYQSRVSGNSIGKGSKGVGCRLCSNKGRGRG